MAQTYDFTSYRAIVDNNKLTVVYNGLEWFCLPISISVGDNDVNVELASAVEENGVHTLTFGAYSSKWAEKSYILCLAPDGISLKAKVNGVHPRENLPASVDRITYCADTKYEASGYILPCAQHASRRRMYREINEDGSIGIHYLAPPLYSFPFVAEKAEGSVAIGIGAAEGEYNFNEFRYTRSRNRCGFVLPYTKTREVREAWETPSLIITFGEDELASLAAYSAWHYNHLGCRKNPSHTNVPRWWKGPFFCGWNEQRPQAEALGLNISQYAAARQDVYEAMSKRLDELDLHPTAIIIDDKWQENYGTLVPDPEKWPDLRGFVNAEHAKGRKVILWFKLWSAEGLPTDECATLAHNPMHTDPTNPAYRERMKKTIYKLLSGDEGCYDCDGFKIDFLSACPSLPGIRLYDNNVRGVELLKKNIGLIHDCAKAAKADALINCSACHPYLAEVVDQSRLHDLSSDVRNSAACMKWRSELFHAAMPDITIDTDEGGRGSREDVLDYMRKAPTIGVPVLYWLTPSKDAPVTAEDWAERRAIWNEYAARQEK